jgi:hypothetical protein
MEELAKLYDLEEAEELSISTIETRNAQFSVIVRAELSLAYLQGVYQAARPHLSGPDKQMSLQGVPYRER